MQRRHCHAFIRRFVSVRIQDTNRDQNHNSYFAAYTVTQTVAHPSIQAQAERNRERGERERERERLSLSLRFNGHFPGEPRLAGVY